jgi:hypothetical protein
MGQVAIRFLRLAAALEVRRPVVACSAVVNTWDWHALFAGLFLGSKVGLSFLLALLDFSLLPGLLLRLAQPGRRPG